VIKKGCEKSMVFKNRTLLLGGIVYKRVRTGDLNRLRLQETVNWWLNRGRTVVTRRHPKSLGTESFYSLWVNDPHLTKLHYITQAKKRKKGGKHGL